MVAKHEKTPGKCRNRERKKRKKDTEEGEKHAMTLRFADLEELRRVKNTHTHNPGRKLTTRQTLKKKNNVNTGFAAKDILSFSFSSITSLSELYL